MDGWTNSLGLVFQFYCKCLAEVINHSLISNVSANGNNRITNKSIDKSTNQLLQSLVKYTAIVSLNVGTLLY